MIAVGYSKLAESLHKGTTLPANPTSFLFTHMLGITVNDTNKLADMILALRKRELIEQVLVGQ